MESSYNVTAKIFEDCVEIHTDWAGDVTKEIIDMKCRIQDNAVRQWLINNGWTPPDADDKSYAVFEMVSDGEYKCITAGLPHNKAKEYYDTYQWSHKSIWKRIL